MRKYVFLMSALFACLSAFAAYAEENDVTVKMKETLSSAYGSDVNVKIDQQKCEVTYPEVIIEKEITQPVEPQSPDEEPQTEVKTVTTTIPETVAQCSQTDDFNTHKQYKITHNSPQKIIAQLYNLLGFAFVKDIDIKDFSEETQIVPELGLIRSQKIHLSSASYTEKDETTGLKSEVGNLGNYELSREATQESDNLIYRVNMNLDMFNAVLPFFSLQIKSEKNISEFIYKLPQDKSFDYANLAQNVEQLLSAKSAAVGHGIKVGIDMFGIAVGLDTNIKNNTRLTEDKTIETFGTILLDNIAFTGNLISKEKQAKAIELKYSFQDLPPNTLSEMLRLQKEKSARMEKAESLDEITAAKNASDEQFAEMMDKLAETAKLTTSLSAQFADAEIAANFAFERTNGYLTGVGKIKVTNLYNIFPEQKQCLNNPKADEIPACTFDFAFSAIKDYIDTSKDSSETIYKYDEKGVYKNGVKIDEPVELNFKKMYQKKLQEDKERQEMLKKLMEESAAEEAQNAASAPAETDADAAKTNAEE